MMSAQAFVKLGPDDFLAHSVRSDILAALKDREVMAKARLKIQSKSDDGDPVKFPAEPKLEDLWAICDTREKDTDNSRYDLDPMQWVWGTLDTGDYSLIGLEHLVRIERKSFPDFLQTMTHGRERFEKEIIRLKAYPFRHLVIEATWDQIAAGEWPEYEDKHGELKIPQVKAEAAIASIWSWMAQGIPVTLVGTRARGQAFVRKALHIAARHEFENVRRAITGRMVPYMIPKDSGLPEEYQ